MERFKKHENVDNAYWIIISQNNQQNFQELDYLKRNLKLNTNSRYQEGNKIIEFHAQGRNAREEI